GETCLEHLRDGVPNGSLEIDEETPVRHLAGEGEAPDARVVVAKPDDLRLIEARKPHQHAVEARECLVAVPRDRPPPMDARRIEPRPAPLVLMPVPVPDEHIHEPGGKERARVDPVARTTLEMLEQLLDRKSTRLNSSHGSISYAVFCL